MAMLEVSKKKNKATMKQLKEIRHQIELLRTPNAEKALLHTRQRYYVSANKAGRLLARQVRKVEAKRTIAGITQKDGTIAKDTETIVRSFETFYGKLYSSDYPYQTAVKDYFRNLHLCKITPLGTALLEKDIIKEKVEAVIKAIPRYKAPTDSR